MNFFKKNKLNSKGFSLIEMVIVVAIFIIITSVALSRQSKFSSDILITNLAYEIALSIREAQVYGIGSKVAPSNLSTITGSDKLKVGYGINVSGVNGGDKPSEYHFFADFPDNVSPGHPFLYYPGTSPDFTDSELITPVELTRGQKVRNFCGKNSQGWDCWDTDYDGTGDVDFDLNIVFLKPDPDANMWGVSDAAGAEEYSEAVLVVESSLGDKCRIIYVNKIGQISVLPQNSGSTSDCEKDIINDGV